MMADKKGTYMPLSADEPEVSYVDSELDEPVGGDH